MATPTDRERQWLLVEKYDGVESPAFFADLARLESGEPLAYLIGHVPFLGTTISLGSHSLIPRTETEYWVERAIAELREMAQGRPEPLRILDLCAGSGAIGIAVLAALPETQVDFVELEERHHATIRQNLEANGIAPGRAVLFGGDLFGTIPSGRMYAAILTNPPYVDPVLRERVAQEVLVYEPHAALFGGEGGMALIERIVAEAPARLAPGGILYLEHEPEQVDALSTLAKQHRYTSCEHLPDQYGVLRYTRLVRT